MAQLETIVIALARGCSVRRNEWEPVIRMFVDGDLLMCQCNNSKPWQHSLTWDDIAAKDWQLV